MMKGERIGRWETCLHESAHVVVARAVNAWDTFARAHVLESGRGGFAELPTGLSPYAEAVAVAAGDHAEKLPFDPPPRRNKPKTKREFTAAAIREKHVVETTEKAREAQFKRSVAYGDDADRVARYCISLHPSEPDEWKLKFDAVHAEAGRLVWELRDPIRETATTLFHRGKVTIPGNPEDEAFFAGGAVAAGDKQCRTISGA